MSNLELWGMVEKTPIDQQKEITGKAYKGNSPKPHYLVHKATETFGPCGIGWGFEIIEEKLLEGALIAPGFYEKIHMVRLSVWYKWKDQTGRVEHVGQTLFCGERRNGNKFTDEDAPKKSVTDALVKALSMIGFAGDIFMGRYEDNKYLQELRNEAAEEKTPPPPEKNETGETPQEVCDRLKKQIDCCHTKSELDVEKKQEGFKLDYNWLDRTAKKPKLAADVVAHAKKRMTAIDKPAIQASNDELTGNADAA